MEISSHAAAREAQWLSTHPGGHEYSSHDLFTETQEELADAWNYVRHAEIDASCRQLIWRYLGMVYELVEMHKETQPAQSTQPTSFTRSTQLRFSSM